MSARDALSIAIPITALPSAAWRLAVLAGAYGPHHPVTFAMRSELAPVLSLSIFSVAGLAGLVAAITLVEQGKLKRLRPMIWYCAAAATAVTLIIEAYAILNSIFHWVGNLDPRGREFQLEGAQLNLAAACYAPLLLTAPMLTARVLMFRTRMRSLDRGPAAAS